VLSSPQSSIRGQRAWWKSPLATVPVIAAFAIGVMITESSAPLAHESEITGAPMQGKANTRGITPRIKYEEGFLSDLNGKYKLRVTEITIIPRRVVGDHNHRGPGIRQVTEGKKEYIMPAKNVTYGPDDYCLEAGNVSYRAENRTDAPCTHLLFEILPLYIIVPSRNPLSDPR
jgi:quercetin dioxygenase-like cupin family protein